MIKKIINITFAVLLLIATTGFTVSKHYCGNKLVSVSVDSKADSCCGNEKGGCCHNETQYVQLKESFVALFIQFDFKNTFLLDLPPFTSILLLNNFHFNKTKFNLNHFESPSPPLLKPILAKLQRFLL